MSTSNRQRTVDLQIALGLALIVFVGLYRHELQAAAQVVGQQTGAALGSLSDVGRSLASAAHATLTRERSVESPLPIGERVVARNSGFTAASCGHQPPQRIMVLHPGCHPAGCW